MYLIDILFLGWIVNFISYVLGILITIIHVSYFMIIATPAEILEFQLIRNKFNSLLNKLTKTQRILFTFEHLFVLLLPFAYILKLLRLLAFITQPPRFFFLRSIEKLKERYNLEE